MKDFFIVPKPITDSSGNRSMLGVCFVDIIIFHTNFFTTIESQMMKYKTKTKLEFFNWQSIFMSS